jgi:ABC-2 type transport system permease protein
MRGYLALTASELRLFLREPFAVIFVLVFPLMMMLLLAAVFGSDAEEAQATENGMLVWRGVVPTDYYTAASVAVVIAAVGVLTIPGQLASYREQGILRRMEASSVPAWAVLASQLTVAIVMVVAGAVVMTLSSWLIYDTTLPEDPLGVVVAILLGTLCFSALGALLATFIRTSRAAQGIGLLLFLGMWLIAGTAPPRAVLPSGLRDFGEILPLTHIVIAVQDAWFGFGWATTDLAIIAAITIAAAIPAIWFFRWD